MKTVAQCMKRNVLSIGTRAIVREAIALIVRHHIGTIPVVDTDGLLVGTLRLADLIGLGMPDFLQFLDHIEFIHTFGALEIQHPGAEVLAKPVTELMSEAVSVEENAGLLRASALLYKNQLMDIPVVDHQHRLVGIASRVDIGTALLKDWIEDPAADDLPGG
jgi:CBS-domain-containing membrane protein